MDLKFNEAQRASLNLSLTVTIEMPTDNYDASLVMKRRQAAVLAAYNAALQADTSKVRREQTSYQSAEVVVLRKIGGCTCDSDVPAPYVHRSVPGLGGTVG
jgi:hypothetical protein